MAKKQVCLSIEPEIINVARSLNLNLSELAQNAFEQAVNVTLEVMKQNSESIDELLKERKESARLIKQEADKIKSEQLRLLTDMRLHADAAKAAGIPRGQAESDFGRIFPDAVWGVE
jgi:hypothetical protein